jgi:integrase
MAALRGDEYVKLPSPSKALGMQRTGVRQSAPQGQDREQVKQIVNALCRDHQQRAAAIVLLARATGMRLREAILADLPQLSREANDLGKINIRDSTKGGHAGASAPRWIPWMTRLVMRLGLLSRYRLPVVATRTKRKLPRLLGGSRTSREEHPSYAPSKRLP